MGGVLGAAGHDGAPLLHYLPTARHTWRSDVNVARLPSEVSGVRREDSRIEAVPVAIKGSDGTLLDNAIPKVAITKDASYWDDYGSHHPEAEVDLVAMIGYMLKSAPLAGFVVEGFTPYGRSASNARHQLMRGAREGRVPDVARRFARELQLQGLWLGGDGEHPDPADCPSLCGALALGLMQPLSQKTLGA
jgi:hypothetical protein